MARVIGAVMDGSYVNQPTGATPLEERAAFQPRRRKRKGFQERIQHRQPGYFCYCFLISFMITDKSKMYILKVNNVMYAYIIH